MTPGRQELGRRARALAASDRPLATRLRDKLSRARDALDHPQLSDARRLLRMARVGAPDVLLFGESALAFVGPRDSDRRRLPRMVADTLGPGISTAAVYGGGYHAELLARYLELLALGPHRPRVVVVALWLRGRFPPWIVHPRFGHVDALKSLGALDTSTPTWRVRGSLRRAGPLEFARFHDVRHPTLAGDLSVGDYVVPLKSYGHFTDDDARTRLLYAYHHGAELQAGSPQLQAVTRLGAAVKALGSSFFAYQTPLSWQTGESLLGSAFPALVKHNFGVMDAAFREGAGEGATVLQTGSAHGPEDFIDPADGSEHLNERGRQRLSQQLADQAQTMLRVVPPPGADS